MADTLTEPLESLSSWWRVAALATMAGGFAVLILLTVKAYQNAPPIPDKFVDPAGGVVITADDVIAGQQVFLKHGLMDNGTIWGHGGYLGPDFSAQSLHILARSTKLTAGEQELLQVSSFKSQVSLHWITDPGESRFPLLVKILAEQGLDESWAREQLSTGSCAILATAGKHAIDREEELRRAPVVRVAGLF